jgi:hypothetical protein
MTENERVDPYIIELAREVQELKTLVNKLIALGESNSTYRWEVMMRDRANERAMSAGAEINLSESVIELYKIYSNGLSNARNRHVKNVMEIMGFGTKSTTEKLAMLERLDKEFKELYNFLRGRYGNEGETSE